MSATSALAELDGAGLTYDGSPPVDAVRPTDLVVHGGEWVAILGPSGSGKSSLLNLLGLLDRPTCGRYRLCGSDVTEATERARADLRAGLLGFVFQAFHLLARRSVTENVVQGMLFNAAVERRTRRRRADDAIERVGLGHRRDATPESLSGGERQRVAIARAIANRPRLLLADEPTGNLDSGTSSGILDLFEDLRVDGMTLVTVTHDERVADRADRVLLVQDGLVCEGPR